MSEWKLVPAEPTGKMLMDAADNLCGEFGVEFVTGQESFAKAVYREFLDAAPKVEPLAWLVTGGSMFKDRAFISERGALISAAEREDGAKVIPLYATGEQQS